MNSLYSVRLRTIIGIVCLMAVSGCQTFMASPQEPTSTSDEVVKVQIRKHSKKPRNLELPLKPNMRLQDVVKESKPGFRNKSVYIVRTSPKTGERHKLQASFGSSRRITMETDYAIQPGDRVVIAEDTTSSFDKVMRSLMGRE